MASYYERRTLTIWQAACERGEPQACADAARLVRRGPTAAETTRALARRACDGGIAASCVQLRVWQRYDGEESLDATIADLDRLCRGGEPTACSELARILRSNATPHSHRDRDRAVDLIQRACDLGAADACVDAGLQHAPPRTKHDVSVRFAYYRRACERGALAGCVYLAMDALAAGARDDSLSLARYACQRGLARGCTLATQLYGALDRDASAAPWFTESCRRGDTAACRQLLAHRAELPGLRHEMRQRVYRSACETKNEHACKQLSILDAQHRRDLEAARNALTRQDDAALAAIAPRPVALSGLWFDTPECSAQFSGDHELTTAEHPAFLRCLATIRPSAVSLEPTSERAGEDAGVDGGGGSQLRYEPGVSLSIDVEDGALQGITAPDVAELQPTAAPLDFAILASHLTAGTTTIAVDPEVRSTTERNHDVAFVRLLACVDPSGKLERATVLQRSVGHDSYVRAVENAAAAWRFAPFSVRGQAVRVCALELFAYPPDQPSKVNLLRAETLRELSAGSAVAPTALEANRIAGDMNLTPPPVTKTQISRMGADGAIGSFKLCLSAAGEIDHIEMLQSTGFDGYDRTLLDGMDRWKYRPFLVNGQPRPVCTAVTFIYSQR
jgi:TPR repeat protein